MDAYYLMCLSAVTGQLSNPERPLHQNGQSQEAKASWSPVGGQVLWGIQIQ